MATINSLKNKKKERFQKALDTKTWLCVLFMLFACFHYELNAQCSYMKDYHGIIATIAKGSTAGQSFKMEAGCTNGDNTFEYFEINHQSPWNNRLTVRIYEGKTFTGEPRYTQGNISINAAQANTKIKINLEGGDGDLSFEAGETYTITITPEISHFRWNGDRNNSNTTNEALWPNNGGRWAGTFDYFYTIGTANSNNNSSTSATQLTEFYQRYPSGMSEDFKDVVETYIEVEDLVIDEDYSQASQKLSALWTKYPKGSDVWDDIKAHNVWVGIPAAYNGLRALDDVVNFHLTNSSPCSDPIAMNIKVVLVGKTSGLMPANPNQMTAGQGTQTTKTLDGRLTANNNKLIEDLLFVFSGFIEASTKGVIKPNIEVIELPNFEYLASVKEVSTGKASAYGDSYPDIWSSLQPEQKNSTDLWWIMYPSFVPGIGGQASTSTPNFNGTSFYTGGKDIAPTGAPVIWCDDIFFLEKQLHTGGGSITDIERRCYAAMWFQHEFFHHLFDAFPTFRNLRAINSSIPVTPDNLEQSGHVWFTQSSWPSDFQGKFEADYFHEAMEKRLKEVVEGPLAERLIVRRDAVPSNILNSVPQSEIEGNYEALVVLNGYNEFSITKDGNKYVWENLIPIKYYMNLNLSEGIFTNGPGNLDVRLQLKIDKNTCQFTPEVIGIRHAEGLNLKK